MILIAIGANLVAPGHESVPSGCQSALDRLSEEGIEIISMSRWYLSAPVPAADQPWFHNAVFSIKKYNNANELLLFLHKIEEEYGRVRETVNGARTLDLDLLDYDGLVQSGAGAELPHPRLGIRRFVLMPLAEIAPDWCHPVTGSTAPEMLGQLPPDTGDCFPLDEIP